MDKWYQVFQKNITEEEYHDNKSNKHNPTSSQIEISKVTDKNKVENSMKNNAEYTKR